MVVVVDFLVDVVLEKLCSWGGGEAGRREQDSERKGAPRKGRIAAYLLVVVVTFLLVVAAILMHFDPLAL